MVDSSSLSLYKPTLNQYRSDLILYYKAILDVGAAMFSHQVALWGQFRGPHGLGFVLLYLLSGALCGFTVKAWACNYFRVPVGWGSVLYLLKRNVKFNFVMYSFSNNNNKIPLVVEIQWWYVSNFALKKLVIFFIFYYLIFTIIDIQQRIAATYRNHLKLYKNITKPSLY